MHILNDKNVRRQAAIIVLILLSFNLLGQLAVLHMADDYKKAMIAHDNAIAGYLSRNGIDNHQIILAFTSDKTYTDAETGTTLLTASGYKESIKNSLLPETL